jgi:DNA-binding transcriptional MerR regulator
VHQLLAFKSLGLSLQTIKSLLDGDRIDIASHCARLSREREELTRAIDALSQLPAQAQGVTAFNHFVAEFTWERAEAMRQRFAANTPLVPARVCESRLASFHALARALEVDPGSEETRALGVAFRSTSDADAQAAVKDRSAWPSGMRRYFASLYDASPEMWERVLTFLETLPPASGAASCA